MSDEQKPAAPRAPNTVRPAAPGGAPRPAAAKPAAADPAKEAEKTPLGRVVMRNEFYRDGFRMMLILVVMEAVIIMGLVLGIIAIIKSHEPNDRYFATTEDGRLIEMEALSTPNLNRPALLSWAAQAATETMTFGFHDYRRRLQEASRNFTRTGWASFVSALQSSGMLQTVNENRQVITAAPRAAPTILSEGLSGGVYRWEVEMPMMITYQFGQQQRDDSLNLRLIIVRMPKLESPNGVGIEQWIAYKG